CAWGGGTFLDFRVPEGGGGEPFCGIIKNLFYCIKKKLYLCKSDKWDNITVIINLINLILWHLKDKS
ncbi:MAG: hypothetical protein K6E96_06560, partial [Bacteroidales bacterium]|nr:hypothetical protein [Bacteroidales bacterium]